MELENNAYFWQKLDTLLMSGDLSLDRPKGTRHPQYSNLIYPVDYGYLHGTITGDPEQVGVYKGSIDVFQADAIVVCADILKKDLEVKILVGCTEKEIQGILEFLNQTNFQKSILIRRGNNIPIWAAEK